MLQPFLFIGVGGSGGDTLRHLYRELERRVHRAGYSRMPAGWQFLHIDSRTTEEHDDVLPALPRGAYYGLAGRNVNYQTVARYMDRQPPRVHAACVGWRPDPDLVHVAIEEGAGQFRAIGRAIAVAKMSDINVKVREAVERVEHGRSQADLAELDFALSGEASGGRAPNPVVIVFSSLAGGTGSGIFLDVCDLLRGLDRTWTSNSVSVLYAPDVFDGLRDDLRRGVQANALAAVSEMLAGHWFGHVGADPVHEEAGAVFRDMRRSGPAYSFLVGTTNGVLTFTDQQDVFGVVARTVAAWATSPAIQKQFSSYVQSNWQQGADRPDPLGLIPKPVDMPLSSLGYASVGLGRDLFGRYAAQCLARATAERLLHGATGAPADETGPGHDVDTVVRERRQKFTDALLGLAAQPEDSLFALFCRDRDRVLATARESVIDLIGRAPRSISDWNRLLASAIAESRKGFLDARRAETRDRAELWLKGVRDTVHRELRRSVAADGLVVTLRLVRAVIDFLKQEEVPALDAGALQDDEFGRSFGREVAAGLGPEPGGILRRKRLFPAEHERVSFAVENGVEAAFGRNWDAEVRRLCARLLADFSDNLLRPLLTELERGLQALRRDALSAGDKPSAVSRWPQGPAYPVPLELRPGSTQFVVDYVDDYPAKFAELMGKALHSEDAGITDAVAEAIRAILTDDVEYQGSQVRLFEQPGTWQPAAVRDWSDRARVAQAANFRLNVTADDLLRRANAWLAQADGFTTYLQQTLGEALGGLQPTLEQQERLNRFTAQLEQAIEASSPLVRMDAAYLNLHSGTGTEFQPLISPIPLEPESVAYHRATEVLLQHTGLSEEKVRSQFSAAGSSEIEFTTFLNVPCHPVAFNSLTRPIRSDWHEKRGHADRRAAFNRWRRARPLPRAVPLPNDIRQQMVRGWLVLFAASELSLAEGGQYLEVTTPLSATQQFPLIGVMPHVEDVFDTMAAALESLPLLLIEQAGEDSGTIRAYRHLLEVDGMADQLLKDEAVRDRLEDIVRKAEQRLPSQPPAGADRIWDLRADILDAVAVLRTKLETLS